MKSKEEKKKIKELEKWIKTYQKAAIGRMAGWSVVVLIFMTGLITVLKMMDYLPWSWWVLYIPILVMSIFDVCCVCTMVILLLLLCACVVILAKRDKEEESP